VGLIVIIIAFAVILSPFPLPIPSPTTLRPTPPLSSFPVEDHWLKTIWLGLPPSIITGARRRNLRLARGSAESVRLRAHCYLHHALSRPHTRPRTLTTPLDATTLHTSLLRAPCPHPCTHSHLYFGYKLPVLYVPLGLALVAHGQSYPPHSLT